MLRGFSFLILTIREYRKVGIMDRIEAKRNIEKYETEITKWQALSRGLMSRDEMMLVDKKIAQFKERSKNLRNMLNA